jgi:predicted AAA+ superfamily ATPase
MPEVVALYAEKKDLIALHRVYDSLLNGFRDDSEKYARNVTMRGVLRHILTYGWQYAGQRITFERFANSNYKSREMSEAFQTLEKAMILELSYPALSTEPPVQPDMKKSPKLLWIDTGLVNYTAGLQQVLFGVDDISQSWKGRIAEHIVAQSLLVASASVSTKRNFWVRDARNSQAEVDFLLQYNGQLLPVEVKSGDNSKLKSLQLFMEQSKSGIAIRLWNQSFTKDLITLPSGKKYTLLNLPFYYTECVEKVLTSEQSQ